MRKLLIWAALSVILLPVSCNNRKNELTLLKISELSAAKISDSALVEVLEQNIHDKIRVEYSLMEDTALVYLRENKVDMAILPNNTTINIPNLEVRTIAPLLPRILVILNQNIADSSAGLKGLIENHPIIFEDLSRLDTIFFKNLFMSFGIDIRKVDGINVNSIRIKDWQDSSFVFMGLTHLHNPIMKFLIDQGAVFYPLDKVENLGRGSAAEGFILDFPSAKTFILPKSFHHGKPKEPVLTVSILDILVCRNDMDYNLVYTITENLVQKKPQLVQADNIYSMLETNFRNASYSFPYHKGTLAFLNRDKPPIWSRYASLIWPIVSMLAILIGAIASFRNRMKQRRRHRIETYYGALLKIRNQMEEGFDHAKLLAELARIRINAFKALSKNKLSANESFSIFLMLYHDVEKEIMIRVGK